MQELYGWGRVPRVRAEERLAEDLEAASRETVLARGLGRSYGDASLPPPGAGPVLGTRRADRLIAFDPRTGRLRAEAGLSVRALNEIFLGRGFAPPVSPGTQYVTLGGMVASDVHGKNHHVAGTIGAHVHALRMRVPDGRVLEVTDANEPELFRATLGGMGLTGHVLEVELGLERIPSPWIHQEVELLRDLDDLLARLAAASARAPFSVAWVDVTRCGRALGRGALASGRWAEAGEAPARAPRMTESFAVPFMLPGFAISPPTVRVFNVLYRAGYALQRGASVVSPRGFFYPLDALRDWHRLYGRAGMIQHQSVLPRRSAAAILPRYLEIARHGGASPVTVVKDCGAEGRGLLSFPMPGISVALDFPMRGARTQAVVDALNELVIEAGGRIYLTKDALTRAEHFRAMEPRLASFQAARRKWDPEGRMRSALAARLLDPDAS